MVFADSHSTYKFMPKVTSSVTVCVKMIQLKCFKKCIIGELSISELDTVWRIKQLRQPPLLDNDIHVVSFYLNDNLDFDYKTLLNPRLPK